MLLLLLLQGVAEAQQQRLLIDALVTVNRRSAASICRQAGVQPSNLTRFRQMGGENQISSDLQDELLSALEWPDGLPREGSTCSWRVGDNEAVAALSWLLNLDALKQAKFVKIDHLKKTGELGVQILVGKLTPFDAYCHIFFDSDALISHARLKDLPRVTVTKDLVRTIWAGNASSVDFGHMFLESIPDIAHATRLNLDLVSCFESLEITRDEQNELLETWLLKLARKDPNRLSAILHRIDRLKLNGELIVPKAMTKRQTEKFITDLANSADQANP